MDAENHFGKSIRLLDELRQQLLALGPTDKQVAEHLYASDAVELTYNSNAIEGSTLSLLETKLIIQEGLTISGKSLREHQEAKNHQQALDYLQPLITKAPYVISEAELLTIHRIILAGINYDWAGKYREQPVYIKTTEGRVHEFCAWSEVAKQVLALLDWLRANDSILHPVILAAEFHYRLVSIHPFVDGNGRTARLAMNLLLLQNDFPLSIISVEQRLAYLHAIETARNTGDMQAFYSLHFEAVEIALHKAIKTHKEKIIWR